MKIYSLLLYLIFITEIHGTESIRRDGNSHNHFTQRAKLNSEQDKLKAKKIIVALSNKNLELEADKIIKEFSIPNEDQIIGTNGRAVLSAFFDQKTKLTYYEIVEKSGKLRKDDKYNHVMLYLLSIKHGCRGANDFLYEIYSEWDPNWLFSPLKYHAQIIQAIQALKSYENE